MKKASMNHAYRLVWNEVTGTYVAVAEHCKGRRKRASSGLLASVLLASAAHAAGAGAGPDPSSAASALPKGVQLAGGQATVTQNGNQLTVQQQSQRAILNWQEFNIGDKSKVTFAQPNAQAIALNRITGGAPTQIQGELTANGQVWLINASGVVFGKGAQVNVGGLVASSLNIKDADFMGGKASFAADGVAGSVVNQGQIQAQGGVVALLAPVVRNEGSVTAGQVLMGAGDKMALDFGRDGLVSLAIERAALDALVDNSGQIAAGSVILSARSANALQASVVNNSGVIEAKSLVARGGRILLDGGEQGEVHVSGRLDASSSAAQGGTITVQGEHLRLDGGAQLDASGATGGGQIQVGGGWQGKDANVRNATSVQADASVLTKADAVDVGKGGEVVFWSDDKTQFAGNISVRGGAQSGDGGRAEVSGKQVLQYSGRTDARAAKGRTGDLLLDPSTLEISGGGSGSGSLSGSQVFEKDIEAQNANVLLQATGDILVNDLSLNGGDGKITMQPDVSLRIEAGTANGGHLSPPTVLAGDTDVARNFDMMFANAANTLEVSGKGSLMLVAGSRGSGRVLNTPILIAHGAGTNAATLPTHDVRTPGSGTPADASITIFGADGATVGGAIQTQGGYVRIWADSDNGGLGYFTLNAPVTTHGGNLYVSTGSGEVTLNSNMVLDNGRIFFKGDGTHTEGNKVLAGLLSVSGDVNVDTPFIFRGGASIHTDGNINFGAVNINMDTGTGVLTLRANKIDWGTATLSNLSTASLRLEPATASTNMVLGDANGFASKTTLDKLPGIKNLTIGREDGTGTISVPSDFDGKASGHFEMVNKTVEITAGKLINTLGDITLTGDTINISQAVDAKNGTGKVTIRQMTASNDLHLGTGLNNATIGHVNAATLAVGREDGGNLVFDSDISTTATSVHLLSGQQVIGRDGGVAAENLAVTAGGGAVLSDSSFNFKKLALKVGGDTDVRSSTADWGLGAVDGLGGLSINAGQNVTVVLNATGQLDLKAPIAFNGTSSTLQLHASTGLVAADATTSATVSGQSKATVEFTLDGANASFELGGQSSQLSEKSAQAFNGVKVMRVKATDDDVKLAGLTVNVGDRVEIAGRTLVQQGAQHVNTGSLFLSAEQAGLQLDQALTASGTVSLNDKAGAGIAGSGQISAAKLALRSSGGDVTLNSSVHQVGEIAADVGSLQFKTDSSLTVGSADGLGGIHAARTVDVRAQGSSSDIVLKQAVKADNANAAATPLLLAAGRNFRNEAGAQALQATAGHWHVYSTTPTADERGGLAYQFKQYQATTSSTVLGAGDGFLYTVAPKISVSLKGTTSKVYDGKTEATLSAGNFAQSGAIDGDQVAYTVGGQARYANKNVGQSKQVSVDGIVLGQASNGTVAVYGYALQSNTASGAIGEITPKHIGAATGSVKDKVYDGKLNAELGKVSLQGLVAGDAVQTSGGAASFNNKNVGKDKAVSITGLSLIGADAGNYSFDGAAQASITPKSVSVADVKVSSKVYDGTTSAQVSGGQLAGGLDGEQLGFNLSAEFLNKNAGVAKDVNVKLALSGADAGNYQLASDSVLAKGDITPKTVTAGAVAVATKVYDGNRQAEVSGGKLQGLIDGDQVDTTRSGEFADKNAGKAKDVAVTLALTGADAGNYQLAGAQVQAKGDITPKTVTAGAVAVMTKVYDGNRQAEVSGGKLQGLIDGDRVDTTRSGEFADKNAGKAKDVAVTLGLVGADAGNYQLAGAQVQAKGDITPKTVTAGAVAVATKVYDGNRQAEVSGGKLQGLIDGDQVDTTRSGEFADKNAGKAKDVAVTLALTGADAGNYQLAGAQVQAKGDITPKTLQTAPLVVKDKYFDGSRDAQLEAPSLIGVVAGDSVRAQATGQFQDLLAADGKQVVVKLNLDGTDAGNYQLAHGQVETVARILSLDAQGQTAGLLVKPQGGNATGGAGATASNSANGSNGGVSGSSGAGANVLAGASPATGPVPTLLALAEGVGSGGDAAGPASAARSGQAAATEGGQHMLRNGGHISLSMAGNAPTEPVQNLLPLFRDSGASGGLDHLGHYLVQDQGDSLSLQQHSLTQAELPKHEGQNVSARAETLLDLGQGETAGMSLEFLSNGTLRATMQPQAAQLGHEVLSAHGLSVIKRKAGVSVDQVRSIVLRFDAKN
ncbi:YDG domain-containing protein [Paucibacter sp. KCTC 42545]|uniref:YDG domain-containing protein n=1 Tax=Paucibacter sp. KCTC 42545 TaxID=1768242 RepID=UPI0009E7DBE8|nr:YDG domain-containing protein [Paucibacter sp. KCTC 42545]